MRELPAGVDGLWIPHCRAVHTILMSAPLTLIWVDAAREAVRIDRGVAPGRWVVRCRGADSVLEMFVDPPAQIGVGEAVNIVAVGCQKIRRTV